MDATTRWPLRPLGIGEIFDRAVAIYVRNFVVFTAIVLTLLVPLAVLQYYALPSQSAQWAQVIEEMEHPEHAKSASSTPTMSPQGALALVGFILIALCAAPLTNNAVAVGVASAYFGKRPSYRDSFAAVLPRWLPTMGVVGMEILALFGAYIATIIVTAIFVFAGIMLLQWSWVLGVIVFVIYGVLMLAALALLALLLIAATFAFYAIAIERQGVFGALGGAFARVFNRGEFGKALLMALAFLGVEIGVVLVSAVVGLLTLALTKSYALQLAVNSIFSAMLTAFLTVLLAVYYYDVRTRREGLDLEADLGELAGA